MGLLDDFERGNMGRTVQTNFTPQTDFTPQTNFRPETSFKPDFGAGAMGRTVARPGANAINSPPPFNQQNTPEDPGSDQRKKLIQQSVPGANNPFVAEIKGTYYHVPTVVDGKQLSQDEAAKLFVTGQLAPVSRFKTPEAALAALSNGNNAGQSSPHMETPGQNLPGTASPGSSIGQRQPSLAGMNDEQLSSVNAGLPDDRRSIQTIRGNNVGWFNPQQEREFATLGESMRGIPGGPTYESEQAYKMSTEKNKALIDAHVAGEEAKSRGSLAELNRAAELANTTGKSLPAKGVLDKVEGGANKAAVPGGAQPPEEEPTPKPEVIDARRLEAERRKKLADIAEFEKWYGPNYRAVR